MRPARRRPAVAFALAISLVLLSVMPATGVDLPAGPPEGAGHADDPARDSWIVTLAAGIAVQDAPGLAGAAGGRVGHVYRHVLNGFQLLGSPEAAAALSRNPRVASVQADTPLTLTADTLPFGVRRVAAYGLGGAIGAYQEGFRGNGARIAVLDTGIDLDHPDLVAQIDPALGKNCVDTGLPPNDGHGHGTHVAGTAAGPINGIGTVGVAMEATLVAVKMFTDSGTSSVALSLCALDHIVALNTDAEAANDIHVANMSWGEQRSWGDCASDSLHGAICAAHVAGIILVAGAGNSNVDAGSFVPAAYPEVISVSALADFDGLRGGLAGCGFVLELLASECDDSLAFFSNKGASVDIIAPGVQIYSTWAGGGWKTSSGTSMAAPHVAGVAAIMAAAAPGLSPADARVALLSTGECPNGEAAGVDGVAGCNGQGTWRDDTDGSTEPLAHALRAAQAVAGTTPPDPDPVPPSAPSLTAIGGVESVGLSWTAPDDGGAPITGYQVYRGDTEGSIQLLVDAGLDTEYVDAGVVAGQTYWYQVAAENDAGLGARSTVVSAVPVAETATPPSAPSLTATAGNALVNLSWTPPTDDGGAPVTAYEIYRGTSPGAATLLATVGSVLSYQDAGLANGTTYWYEVAGVNAAGVGVRSNEVSAEPTAPVTAPSPPRSLKAQKVTGGVKLTWQAPTTNGGSPIIGYYVYRTGGSGNALRFTVSASSLTLTDTLVARRTWYAYTVTARNAVGESQASNIATIKSQ